VPDPSTSSCFRPAPFGREVPVGDWLRPGRAGERGGMGWKGAMAWPPSIATTVSRPSRPAQARWPFRIPTALVLSGGFGSGLKTSTPSSQPCSSEVKELAAS